jgi:hypothetical protein
VCLDDRAVGVPDERRERGVDRGVDHHRVPGVREQPQHLDDADHDVRNQPRGADVEHPAPPLGREHRHRLGVAVPRRVAGVAAAQRVRDGPDHRLGLRHVHLGDEQRQHVRRVLPPLHAGAAA